MKEITRRLGPFRVKEIWFSSMPFETGGCELLEFVDCANRVEAPGFRRTDNHTLTIDLRQGLDTIWSKMDKKSCRYEVRRAERDGVLLRKSNDYPAFFDMNRRFRKAKGIAHIARESSIADHGTLFTAEYGGEMLAGHVYIEDDNTMRWLLGASTRLEHNDPLTGAANRALSWFALRYAHSKGLREFDFGGYHVGSDPELARINFFKESFGGALQPRYNYRKFCLPGLLNKALDKAAIWKDALSGLDTRAIMGAAAAGVDPETAFLASPSGDHYLECVLADIGVNPNDKILDIGCGKGSAMLLMLRFPFARVDGIEISGKLASITESNLRRVKSTRSRVANTDAQHFTGYGSYNIFYMYNPFPGQVMRPVIDLIEQTTNPVLIYNNPVCHDEVIHNGVFTLRKEYPNRWGTGIRLYGTSR